MLKRMTSLSTGRFVGYSVGTDGSQFLTRAILWTLRPRAGGSAAQSDALSRVIVESYRVLSSQDHLSYQWSIV